LWKSIRSGRVHDTVDNVNLIVRRSGGRVSPMTVRDLGSEHEGSREQLPPFWKLFAPGWFRWTATGILCGICAGTAYYLIAILLPKALVDGFARDWPLRHSEPLITPD
jgi:hypothetical protein